jgi:hypothetical protein
VGDTGDEPAPVFVRVETVTPKGEMMSIVTRDTEWAHFARWGYVRIPAALPPAFVAQVQDVVWAQLKQRAGVIREDPATWRPDVVPINKTVIDQAAGVEIGQRLTEAVDHLLGVDQWRPLNTLGGLLLTMPGGSPETWNVPTTGWHMDNDPRNYRGKVDKLMLFTFYSAVQPQGGGTLILSGSPRLLEQYMGTQEADCIPGPATFLEQIANWHPWLGELTGRRSVPNRTPEEWLGPVVDVHGTSVQVVELTGEPGDAVLCHPSMLHAVSPNSLATPRIMRRTSFRRRRSS